MRVICVRVRNGVFIFRAYTRAFRRGWRGFRCGSGFVAWLVAWFVAWLAWFHGWTPIAASNAKKHAVSHSAWL